MNVQIIVTIESSAVRMPNMKFNTPNRISPAMPTAKPPAQRVMPHAALATADNTSAKPFRCRSMSFSYLPIFKLFLLVLLG